MVFKCQENSFLKEFKSTVVQCEKSQLNENDKLIDGYNVILENTILFPEGGGQPCDHGYLNDKPVLNVVRKLADAIHFVKADEAFQIGDVVEQKLDWKRRFDHMQQHSGQHLITAIFEQDFLFDTTAWNLGAEISFIELDTKEVSQEKLDFVERKANEYIAAQTKVSVLTFENNDDQIPAEVTRATRGLPKDHVGQIRVITFDGIESNMCCGTHVENLSQLQIVKLLNVEKSKGKCLVNFLVGNRVLNKLADSFKRELEMNLLLNCGPQSHLDIIQKMKNNIKSEQRLVQKMIKELAQNEAEKLKSIKEEPTYYCSHRNDGIDNNYINIFLKELQSNKETFFFLTAADDSIKQGRMMLQGKVEDVDVLGPLLCTILDGKGNGKNGRFQSKINNLKAIGECEKKIKEYFDLK